ncbi:hypothetical protein SAMN05660350_00458 [Geodermatophilus obscurus]|uniref:Tail sheath protein n=1 Tax=Geodermatophilus obscurus TaxID=1861 RepID=A0A1M7S416_9ACTN|nr:phage tail sheath C-terminal domain-containing protein [Geodermatophilus obscurus]SHN53085.1 hypothetical protein SAMN05660350_00458 [Geodermatophilus obscurus]
MTIPLLSPGVYVHELPSGVRPITGVSTSTTAFVGRARRGPVNTPRTITSLADYERQFGALWELSAMSFAVRQFFLNGGNRAVILRRYAPPPVEEGGEPTDGRARGLLAAGDVPLAVEAADAGAWGSDVVVSIAEREQIDEELPSPHLRFSITVTDEGTGLTEKHRNVSVDPDDFRFLRTVLDQQSRLLRVQDGPPLPEQAPDPTPPDAPFRLTGGADGAPLRDDDLTGAGDPFTDLEGADDVNLLCLPSRRGNLAPATWAAAAQWCRDHRAFLLIDCPESMTAADEVGGFLTALNLAHNRRNAAVYFPRLQMANPLKRGLVEEFAACGAVAGVYARTDAGRGVWKAPAGQEAGIVGTAGPVGSVDQAVSEALNPLGVNVLRPFPLIGTVVWGARTADGADRLASEWRYVPVRRTALFIEETLYRALHWVVFEPNDEPLWSQIRLNVGAFMHTLFRQGAFQGSTPREAYLVKCDADTTTQVDIDRGVVNILVGFAPLKPAEFVVIQLQQLAGQAQA